MQAENGNSQHQGLASPMPAGKHGCHTNEHIPFVKIIF